ncbi:MAG: hypothetical protein GY737_23920 [Desulfobacteraceae bacterium]|nr:hypothetical protein [Desulfobacteraceae bacterium]
MKQYKFFFFVFFVFFVLFTIHTVFAEMKALSDKAMGKVTGQTGVLGNLVGFGEVFAKTGQSKEDLDKAIPFNLAYATKLKDLEKNLREFHDIFQRIETTPLEDGWSYFEFEYDSEDELKNPGEQLTYNDVHSSPVESGLGLFGLGGFQVERSGKTHIRMSGKVKIEFRP